MLETTPAPRLWLKTPQLRPLKIHLNKLNGKKIGVFLGGKMSSRIRAPCVIVKLLCSLPIAFGKIFLIDKP